MRKVIVSMFIGMMGLVLIGCAATATTIQNTQNERVGVFAEIKHGIAPAQGFAVLTIKASIKTHLAGYYLLESKDSIHGKPGYPFLINIDGQAVTWQVDGVKESVPLYGKDGKTSHNPEAGDGIKYFLETKIQLIPGKHKIFFGLPADDYFKEVEVTLKSDQHTTLEYKPVYRYKTQPARIPAFKKGIKEYEVYLNNARI